jgi:tRNA A-37 threonylcarbamoyl transferase component Bud32
MRFHAKGGLGEVHVAEDTELCREVALKRVRREHSQNKESRLRFLREAEITARLEHPGVVPVHGLIHDANGEPCYAMRFVHGQTLAEAVHHFHEADKGKRHPGERRLALRQLLGSFVAVCKTMAYAHSRGVLHRDLKPSNVMLGPYGETLVLDWGLAKTFERDEEARASGEDTVRPSAATDNQETRLGEAVGTPAYMAPEQAAGQWHVVGPASDVYGLGATLYYLLTGSPPFVARVHDRKELMALLQEVQRGAFPAPRQRKKGAPRGLEAACLKAMALRPEDRYLTPLELAKDVENWLADEPISAYREPLLARLGRWGRRHRAWAQAGALSLVLIAVVSVAAVIVVLRSWKHEEAEAQRADENATAVITQTERTLLASEKKLLEVRRQVDNHPREVALQRDYVASLRVRRDDLHLQDRDLLERMKGGFGFRGGWREALIKPSYDMYQVRNALWDAEDKLETLVLEDPALDVALVEATVEATRARLSWAKNAANPRSTLDLANTQARLRAEEARANLQVAKAQLQQALRTKLQRDLQEAQLRDRIEGLARFREQWGWLVQRVGEKVTIGTRDVTRDDIVSLSLKLREVQEQIQLAKGVAEKIKAFDSQTDIDLALARVAEAETRLDEALTLAGEPMLNQVAGNSVKPSEPPARMAPAPDAPEIWVLPKLAPMPPSVFPLPREEERVPSKPRVIPPPQLSPPRPPAGSSTPSANRSTGNPAPRPAVAGPAGRGSPPSQSRRVGAETNAVIYAERGRPRPSTRRARTPSVPGWNGPSRRQLADIQAKQNNPGR